MAEQEDLEMEGETKMLHEWVYNGLGDRVCLHCGNSAGADATMICLNRGYNDATGGHVWQDTYVHGGHYPDGRECKKCGISLGVNDPAPERCEGTKGDALDLLIEQLEMKKESDRQVGGGHYTDMQIQPWDVIDTFADAEFTGYHRGVVISYVMRAGAKGDTAEDFEKAAHHLMKAAEELRRRRDGAERTK
jgi:hypothetical protein